MSFTSKPSPMPLTPLWGQFSPSAYLVSCVQLPSALRPGWAVQSSRLVPLIPLGSLRQHALKDHRAAIQLGQHCAAVTELHPRCQRWWPVGNGSRRFKPASAPSTTPSKPVNWQKKRAPGSLLFCSDFSPQFPDGPGCNAGFYKNAPGREPRVDARGRDAVSGFL